MEEHIRLMLESKEIDLSELIKNAEFKDFGTIEVADLINDPANPSFSVALTRVKGEQDFAYNEDSSVLYCVLKGHAVFCVEDDIKLMSGRNVEKSVLSARDSIFIHARTVYRPIGYDLTCLAIAVPRYDPSKRKSTG